MKVHEIMESATTGATASGSMAPVSQGIGSAITRSGSNLLGGKYTKELTPNTPKEVKRYKHNVVGRFENSVSH